MKKISRLALLSCVLLGGSPLLAKAHKQNKFYVVPLETESFKFDSVDLIGGNVVENRFDIGMDKKFHLLRIYNSNRTRKRGSFGNFTNQFDKRINMKVGYKKERIASSLHKNPKLACEYGWEEIASELFLGKLEGLHASFGKTNKLCNVYDEYHNLKTTLVVKNKRRKKPISNRLKLLKKADGTEVLFYKNSNGAWANVLNVPMTFSELDNGYKLVLDNGDIEIYNYSGRLEEIQSEEKIYTLYYKNRKLVKIADNFQHEMKFRYNKKGLIKKVVSYDDTIIKYRYTKNKKLKEVIYPDNRMEKYVYNMKVN